ncbi:magnesium transporter [bacterium]|nr:magnesium transporter [bacterium]
MLGKLLSPEIEELVRRKDFRALKDTVREIPAADLAELISDLEESDLVVVFRLLPKALATDVFEYLEFPHQEALLQRLTGGTVGQLLEDMSPDDRTALLEELPPKAARQLLKMLSPEERRIATALLNYPEESVGRLMTTDFVYLLPEMTVTDALTKVRRIGIDRETVYALYVVDRSGKLLGLVSLRHLVTAELEQIIGDIMETDLIYSHTDTDQEEAAEMLQHYDLLALPIVDKEDKLVGIVTFDDVMDILEEEFTEDAQLQAAVLPGEESYLDASILSLAGRRVVWLVILLIAEVGAVLVLRSYDKLLESMIALAFFLPAMTATGGNTGTQSAAMVIRALATGEVAVRDALRVMLREVFVGMILSVALGTLAYVLAVLINGDPILGICVALGLSTIVIVSNLAGTLLPLLFERLKMDPALMSGPFISTIVDVFGLVIYMEISLHVLRWWGN